MTTPRPWLSFMQLSHAPFLVAGILAILDGWYLHGGVCLTSLVCSLSYHYSRETQAGELDYTLAIALIVFNGFRLLYVWNWVSFACVLVSVVLYQRCQTCSEHYEACHPWWHLTTSLGTMLLYVPLPAPLTTPLWS